MTQTLISQYTTSPAFQDSMNFDDSFGKEEISKQDFGARMKVNISFYDLNNFNQEH